MLRVQKHAAIHRGVARRRTYKELERLSKSCVDSVSPVVFPEGTRSRNGDLGAFYPGGAYFIERRCRLPIVCVTMDGGYRVAEAAKLGRNLQGCRYRVHIERMYPPARTKQEMETVLADCRARMKRRIGLWRNGVPRM